eukprot:7414590-Pyramimonas_sp.AAC.1
MPTTSQLDLLQRPQLGRSVVAGPAVPQHVQLRAQSLDPCASCRFPKLDHQVGVPEGEQRLPGRRLPLEVGEHGHEETEQRLIEHHGLVELS